MIRKLYTNSSILFTSESKENSDNKDSHNRTVIYSCKFEQTSYGSVLINRPTSPDTIEFYPNSISHIIHDLIPQLQ